MASDSPASSFSAGCYLFLISLLVLFLELACIRWFPAHVLYLTFFTNIVLLASFLGMSIGCLAASSRVHYIRWTPLFLAFALLAGLGIEELRTVLQEKNLINVGRQEGSPQMVFFGTEGVREDLAKFRINIEVLGGVFFLLITLSLIGPGQELGRALDWIPNRISAYTINIAGSIVGILLFAGFSWWQLPPIWWFVPVAAILACFLTLRLPQRRPLLLTALFLCLMAVPALASLITGEQNRPKEEHFWSPYYRIDYSDDNLGITTNLIGHQAMNSNKGRHPAYALPHLLQRDTHRPAFRNVLIIGAGSGNDLSRALQWGAEHIDAVEIDPVIQRLGKQHHPDQPYSDKRVTLHLDDGRNFLRSAPAGHYDLVIYALVDSLVLHSSYSNLRLESYLFTLEAFAEVRRCLKPDGEFVMYNYFRQGWIVARLSQELTTTFGNEPIIMTLPYGDTIHEDEQDRGFTVFMAGSDTALKPLHAAFAKPNTFYWMNRAAPPTDECNGFDSEERNLEEWRKIGPARLAQPPLLRPATDDWPFLYLRKPMIPDVSLRGMFVMGGLAFVLIFLFKPRAQSAAGRRFDWRMFFLGAGFMLIETKAVVHMSLLFGSTWMVNSVVFLAVLLMILAANLFVLAARPERLWPFYVGLLLTLGLNAVVPLNSFLGMSRTVQVSASCLMVFAPIFFAGVVFAVSFRRVSDPGTAFGANIAGAILGGLAENVSMLIGFQYLVLVAAGLYCLSMLGGSQVASEASPEYKKA